MLKLPSPPVMFLIVMLVWFTCDFCLKEQNMFSYFRKKIYKTEFRLSTQKVILEEVKISKYPELTVLQNLETYIEILKNIEMEKYHKNSILDCLDFRLRSLKNELITKLGEVEYKKLRNQG